MFEAFGFGSLFITVVGQLAFLSFKYRCGVKRMFRHPAGQQQGLVNTDRIQFGGKNSTPLGHAEESTRLRFTLESQARSVKSLKWPLNDRNLAVHPADGKAIGVFSCSLQTPTRVLERKRSMHMSRTLVWTVLQSDDKHIGILREMQTPSGGGGVGQPPKKIKELMKPGPSPSFGGNQTEILALRRPPKAHIYFDYMGPRRPCSFLKGGRGRMFLEMRKMFRRRFEPDPYCIQTGYSFRSEVLLTTRQYPEDIQEFSYPIPRGGRQMQRQDYPVFCVVLRECSYLFISISDTSAMPRTSALPRTPAMPNTSANRSLKKLVLGTLDKPETPNQYFLESSRERGRAGSVSNLKREACRIESLFLDYMVSIYENRK